MESFRQEDIESYKPLHKIKDIDIHIFMKSADILSHRQAKT